MFDSLSFFRSTIGLLLLVWILLGVILFVLPMTVYIWIILGIIAALVLLLGGERLLLWGRGEL